jgi:signal transduction histidine kinase
MKRFIPLQWKDRKSVPLYPATVGILTGFLFILFAGFAFFEYTRAKSDLRSMLREEGFLLLESLKASGEQSILAYEELEYEVQKRLGGCALWLRDMDTRGDVRQEVLDNAVLEHDLNRIVLYDARGRRELASPRFASPEAGLEPPGYLLPFLEGASDTLVIGFTGGGDAAAGGYGVAVRRTRGGAVEVSGHAERLDRMRRELGPGRLIREIGGRQGVEYVVLQDTIGILMASQGVGEMSRIAADPFLFNIFGDRNRGTRIIRDGEEEIFEAAGYFSIQNVPVGLFRIGLEMDHYHNIVQKARFRLFFIAVIFVLMGIAVTVFMLANQNVRLLSQAYRRVRTHTGEILENMADAVVAVDTQGIVTVYNRRAEDLFRVAAGRILGRPIRNLDLACAPVIEESLSTGEPVFRSRHALEIGDQKKILSMRTSVLRGSGTAPETVILVTTDMTRQVGLEERIQRQEKLTAMGELASGVAHEIRNPINAIGMIAQRLKREFRPAEDQRTYSRMVDSVLGETRRINDIIQRFLRFARPAALSRTAVDIHSLLQEIHTLFSASAGGRKIAFTTDVKSRETVMLDPDQMKQALLNLLQNSLEAVGEGGRIHLSGKKDKNDYIVEVLDDGPGIPPEQRNKIFNLYYTTKSNGTGMGLPIVYQIVRAHGGEVSVESRPGEGTLFRIRIPLEEKA